MTAVLECKGLSKRYGSLQALEDVNLTIEPGRVVGLLGPNGSGKTTLIKLANGLLTPDGGEILVCGKAPCAETKAAVSYLPDKVHLPEWMTVAQLMELYAEFYADFDRERCADMIGRLNLPEKQRLSQMSKGTKEKVQIVLVMARRARLYLLDEPLAGVDPAARNQILDLIIKNGNPEATVLLSTHLICDIEQILNEFLFLSQGAIVRYDTVQNVRQNEEKSLNALFLEVFGC